MRALAALLVASLALAGCSGGSDDGDGSAGGASSSASSTGPPPPPAPTSDVLHLLAPPEMATAIQAGSAEARTPTDGGGFGGGGGGGQDFSALWEYRVQRAANVTGGEVHVWIEITDTLVNSPFQDPRGPQCTWLVVLELGADNQAPIDCIAEPAGPINPGTKELVFGFLAPDPYELEENETLTVTFRRAAFSASPENSVFVLSGSAEHDSRVVLNGLREPVGE